MAKTVSKRRQFLKPENQSPLYRQAVAVLDELLEQEGMDTVERAFAQVTCDARFKATAEQLKAKLSGGHACIESLQGEDLPRADTGGLGGEFCDTNIMPAGDHVESYVRGRKTVAILSEPYQLSFEAMRGLVQFCDERGLRADVDAESGHFPSRTLRIIVRRWEGDEQSIMEYLRAHEMRALGGVQMTKRNWEGDEQSIMEYLRAHEMRALGACK